MERLNPYWKAIVPLIAGVIATGIAIFRGEPSMVIPGDTEFLQGLITSIFVYAARNTPLPPSEAS